MAPTNLRVDRTKQNSDASRFWLWLTTGSLTPLGLFLLGRSYLSQMSEQSVQPEAPAIGAAKSPTYKISGTRSHPQRKETRRIIPALRSSDIRKFADSSVSPFANTQPEFTTRQPIEAFQRIELPATLDRPHLVNRAATLEYLSRVLVAQQSPTVNVAQKRVAQRATGRIFLFVNQAAIASQSVQTSLVRGRNLAADVLRSRGFTVLEVPTGTPAQAIFWINRRARPGDIALSIQADAYLNPEARGASAFYIAGNKERRSQAERLLRQLRETVPELEIRGAIPDTETALGRLAFTRQARIPAIVLTVGFATNPKERSLIVGRFRDIAQGIANGLETWSLAVSQPVDRKVPRFNLSVKGQPASQRGMIVNGNAYIPVDAVKQLKIPQPITARRIRAGNVSYVRAIDLQDAGVLLSWNPKTRTLALKTVEALNSKEIGKIIGKGFLSQTQLEFFLKVTNPQALQRFPNIAKVYLEEAAIEGVNSDVAFTQALLETNFFRFDRGIPPTQNNFGGLQAIAAPSAATFANVRLGVRAHIQQLKAYANQEALSQPIVSPRFRFVHRGSAASVNELSDRWSADPQYGNKILAILSRLYGLAGSDESLR